MKSKGLLWLTLILGILTTSPSFAILISQPSQFGDDTITLDTDTGLRWLDVFQGAYSYNAVKSMMGSGGRFEGFRYATKQEVHTLLFGSLGIDSEYATSHNAPTSDALERIAHLISFFDYTMGVGVVQENFYGRILDAVFESNDRSRVLQTVLSYNYFYGEYSEGGIQFFEAWPDSLVRNVNPYGHFLVRDVPVAVDEPGSLLLLALGMFFFVQRRRNVRQRK